MSASTARKSLVRAAEDGERRWFLGGGLHIWKATADDTGGAFLLFEDRMDHGKVTPLHLHPDSDETMIVLEGEILMHLDGEEHTVRAGGIASAPRGIPHAFKVSGAELLDRVKQLIHEGNVRRIRIRQGDRIVAEFPLTVGIVGAALAPVLAAVGAIAALATECTIEVERAKPPP